MPDEPLTYFGIDLGTTFSVIAYIDETGRPAVVRNMMTNSETLPSVVYFENADNVVVGASAKNVARVHPDRVVQRVKRAMGTEAQWEFDGRPHTPESISALILKQLAQDAAAYTGREVRDVVVTVPAYFGMLERDATRKAGEIAGLNVIGIVPEPVAAALQYDVAAGDAERTVLVYDLGGGTFDTTVIRIGADRIDVLCTDGDQRLGGVEWDDRLLRYLVDEFTRQANPPQDPTDDDEFMQELAQTAEDVKRQLSQAQARSVPVRFAGGSAIVEVTRDTFEQITRDLLDSTLQYTDRTLDKLARKLNVDDPARHIDDVLLVGGSTKMPAVAERLAEKYGWTPRLHDPDLAVAKGAARFALSRALWSWNRGEPGATEPTEEERRRRAEELAAAIGVDAQAVTALSRKQITTVLPKAFGVKLVDTGKPGWEADTEAASYVEHLVHADETLPSGPRPLSAGTVADNQAEVAIEVYEQAGGEESPELSANKSVDHGRGVISGLPPLPRNSPIDIVMEVDEEGLLHVRATEPTTGKDLEIEVRVSVMSRDDVDEYVERVSAISVRA